MRQKKSLAEAHFKKPSRARLLLFRPGKKKPLRGCIPLCRGFSHSGVFPYASEIAVAGHSEAHVPQLMHFVASISRCPPFSEIAPTGQSGSHVPQFTHVPASILYAMLVPLLNGFRNCIIRFFQKQDILPKDKSELDCANKKNEKKIIFFQKGVDEKKVIMYILIHQATLLANLIKTKFLIPRLCNGSTSDSGSDCGGSNPPWGTRLKNESLKP